MVQHIHSPMRLHGMVLNWLSTGTTLTFAFTFQYDLYVCMCKGWA
jgi:hypothetical protein